MAFHFPNHFLWGAATSAHQVEGDNTNDWSVWEKQNAGRLSRESCGKYPPENFISGKAVEHYRRYRQDIALAASLGHNAHRLSVEWSRIEPSVGTFNRVAIRHYQSVIAELRAQGLEPFVTMYHWTLPLWLRDKGGWMCPDAPEYFERFVWAAARAFPDVSYWITINEPMVYAGHGYLRGMWPPQERSFIKTMRVLYALIEAHRRAYTVIHRVSAHAHVGIVKHNQYFSRFGASIKKAVWNDWMLDQIHNHSDFIGLNYYRGDRIAPATSDMGWAIDPIGLYYVLQDIKRYGKPIYITENGIADHNDSRRADFIRDHIDAMCAAMSDGADVRGYFYWSLLDNFEWDKGFWPEFGLIHVDRATQRRFVRPSALAYQHIIESVRATVQSMPKN